MSKNVIEAKTRVFALRVVNLYKVLSEQRGERVMSKQVLRSGTSIGANIAESRGAQSDKDFFAKISIAYKEGLETEYWLEILRDAQFISETEFLSIHSDCVEICKIIAKMQISLKRRISSLP